MHETKTCDKTLALCFYSLVLHRAFAEVSRTPVRRRTRKNAKEGEDSDDLFLVFHAAFCACPRCASHRKDAPFVVNNNPNPKRYVVICLLLERRTRRREKRRRRRRKEEEEEGPRTDRLLRRRRKEAEEAKEGPPTRKGRRCQKRRT